MKGKRKKSLVGWIEKDWRLYRTGEVYCQYPKLLKDAYIVHEKILTHEKHAKLYDTTKYVKVRITIEEIEEQPNG